MDKLNKIFKEHRAEFEEEPGDGHFERFGERLSVNESKRKGWYLSPFYKVASVLLIVLLSANLVVYFKNSKPAVKETAVVKSDLREASFYYTNSINIGIRDLEQMAREGIGTQKEIVQIKHELSEMDRLFVNLQQEYKANPNDERIINAMIEYYQSKLDIVNTIKTDLENVKHLKSKKHENPEI